MRKNMMFVCSDDTVVLLNPGWATGWFAPLRISWFSSYEEPEEVKDSVCSWAVAEGEGHDQGHRPSSSNTQGN